MTKGCLKDLWTKKASSMIPFGRHCFRESITFLCQLPDHIWPHLTTSRWNQPTAEAVTLLKRQETWRTCTQLWACRKACLLDLNLKSSLSVLTCSYCFPTHQQWCSKKYKHTLRPLHSFRSVHFACTHQPRSRLPLALVMSPRCKSRRNKGCLQTPGQGLDCVSHFWTLESISASTLALDRSFTQTLSATTIRQQRSVSSKSAMSGQQSGLFKLLLI